MLAAYRDRAQAVARPRRRDNADDATVESADPSSAGDTADEQPSGEPTDEQVLAWHEAKGYKIPANRKVNGLMRHRYKTARGVLTAPHTRRTHPHRAPATTAALHHLLELLAAHDTSTTDAPARSDAEAREPGE